MTGGNTTCKDAHAWQVKRRKRSGGCHATFMKFGGMAAADGIRAWMSTLDYRAVFYDRSVDPALGIGGQRIYIFWHENILIPLYLRGHCNLAMLLSQHPDAEILGASPITWASTASADQRTMAEQKPFGSCWSEVEDNI